MIGDVQGKTAVIVDDMIDTAGTLKAAAKTVKEEGAAQRLCGRDPRGLLRQRVREPAHVRPRGDRRHRHDPGARGLPDNIRVLPCAELLTDSIRRIFVDDSVSEVFGGENQLF